MKLSNVLFRWKKALPKGNIFRGKYRLVKQVTPLHIVNKRAELDLEERNMFYLRHPYLTPEQDCKAAESLDGDTNSVYIEEKLKKPKKQKLLGDRFGFLKVADTWE